MNSILGSNFVLAFADESIVKLTDFGSRETIERVVRDCAVVVVPSKLRAQGAVTGTEWSWDIEGSEGLFGEENARFDAEVFGRIVSECAKAGAHVLAASPRADAAAAEATLAASGATFTHVVHGATQGCFNGTSTVECLSDHKGVKKEASTVLDLEER